MLRELRTLRPSSPSLQLTIMVLSKITLLLIFAAIVRVRSQFDSHGFLSIDCGSPANTNYVDNTTGLTYISDDQFIDTGNTSKIIAAHANNLPTEYSNVRYFPTGIRNCFTIRSLKVGFKYLVRATFNYGNYDNLNSPPKFDIYLGVNFWTKIDASDVNYPEIMVYAPNDYLDICLVNTNNSHPFISSIHLRQLQGTHEFVNSTQSLVMNWRPNFGASNQQLVRYPDDVEDRWWTYYSSNWKEISTNSTVTISSDEEFKTPSLVLKTAATTSSTNESLHLYWDSPDISTVYYFIFHFYEVQKPLTGRREFNIFVNGNRQFNAPLILSTGNSVLPTIWWTGTRTYNISVAATPNSTLPPLLNAFELYTVVPVGISTASQDVVAIHNVKEYHKIRKGWSGDPCLPITFLWAGISCTSNSSSITRITSLNLSRSLSPGPLSESLGNLTALEYLDLSNNNLSGSLPSSLGKLTALKLSDIRGNPGISTILPSELQTKQKDGSLQYRYGDINPSPSASTSKNNVTIIAIAVVVPLLVIAVAVAIVLVLKRKKNKRSIAARQNESYQSNTLPNDHANYYANAGAVNHIGKSQQGAQRFSPKFNNRKFSYDDLKKITNDFENNIGTGGYGSVYLGQLANRVEVAVKMLSQTSHQGVQEFLAEAENLSRVHHKNLVALMGYCTDQGCMALVYEYMQEGNLHDKLKDTKAPLSWKQRLQIAYESAQGLEYLHKACNPPLIHRDVKTSNILLNANLEAKIADFGLSRAFNSDLSSHISTRIVGTVGYLDPEYYLSNQLSAKSDVFSLGVVLLEIITGRPPTGAGIQGGNLVQWVRRQLSGGDIESIVDPKIQDKYEVNSLWKVADLACKCTEPTSSKRPTMSELVTELKESLELEASMEETHIERTDNLLTDVSENSNIEMEFIGEMPLIGPSVR